MGTLRVKPTTFSSALSINAEVLCQTCDCEKVRFAIPLKPISCSVCLFQILHFCFFLNIRSQLKMLCAVMAMVILSVGNASVLKDGMMEIYLLWHFWFVLITYVAVHNPASCLCSAPHRLGPFCNCSMGASTDSAMCIQPGKTEPCSGRGDCMCGTCVCYNPNQFEGPFCQFDKSQCQRFGGFLCNG